MPTNTGRGPLEIQVNSDFAEDVDNVNLSQISIKRRTVIPALTQVPTTHQALN